MRYTSVGKIILILAIPAGLFSIYFMLVLMIVGLALLIIGQKPQVKSSESSLIEFLLWFQRACEVRDQHQLSANPYQLPFVIGMLAKIETEVQSLREGWHREHELEIERQAELRRQEEEFARMAAERAERQERERQEREREEAEAEARRQKEIFSCKEKIVGLKSMIEKQQSEFSALMVKKNYSGMTNLTGEIDGSLKELRVMEDRLVFLMEGVSPSDKIVEVPEMSVGQPEVTGKSIPPPLPVVDEVVEIGSYLEFATDKDGLYNQGKATSFSKDNMDKIFAGLKKDSESEGTDDDHSGLPFTPAVDGDDASTSKGSDCLEEPKYNTDAYPVPEALDGGEALPAEKPGDLPEPESDSQPNPTPDNDPTPILERGKKFDNDEVIAICRSLRAEAGKPQHGPPDQDEE